MVLELIIVVLGTWGLTEFLRHSHLAQYIRERTEDWFVIDSTQPRKFQRTKLQLAVLINCGFCLSHWAAIVCVVLWFSPFYITKFVVAIFATVRLANLLNDITHCVNRSPNK